MDDTSFLRKLTRLMKVGAVGALTDLFETRRGLRQSDCLSRLLFKNALEVVILTWAGFNMSVQPVHLSR